MQGPSAAFFAPNRYYALLMPISNIPI